MANNQDARPFADLKNDAAEFRAKFDEDIKECINFLNAQITALICDPDSVRNSGRDVRQNALVDFSKAKYDIFIGVKSLMNRKEKEWLTYMSEMKKLFIENVEIFLAGTKLEVKLPADTEQSLGPRKSPGNRKSTSVTSSVLPIIYNATRNIAGLGSSLQNQDTRKETSNVGNKVQFNRGSRLSTKVNSPPKTSATVFLNDNSYSSESSSNEEKIGVNTSAYKNENMDSSESSEDEVRIEVHPNRRGKQSATSIKLAKSPRAKHEEDIEMDTDEPGLVLPPRNDILDNQATRKTRMPKKNISVSLNQGTITVSRPVRGRRGKQAVQNVQLEDEVKNTVTEDGGDSSASEQSNVQESNNFEEMVEAKTVEASTSRVKGRRGRPGAKSKVQDSKETETAKNRRSVFEEEPTIEVVSAKVRRGVPAVPKNSENSDSEVDIVNTKSRRGRPAVAKNLKESYSDKSVIPKTSGRGRKSVKIVIETEASEPHKNVTFNAEADIHGDLESGVTRLAKSASNSKSWMEILEDMSGNDIVPSTPKRTLSKRKTISNVSEFESAIPSKRLKASSRKSIASVQEVNAANDNLLECDDNYSDWMALKNMDGKVPTHPAIYEVKVWRAKKPAYIGFCDSFLQKLTLYKAKQNSGHKQLDKFVERNYDDIQIRYEVASSVVDAKAEVKNRIDSFIAQHKTTPAYN